VFLDRQHRQRGEHHLVATIPSAPIRAVSRFRRLSLAYVAIMGSDVIDVISLSTFKVVGQIGGVDNVRHVVIDPRTGLSLRLAEHPGRRRQDQSTDRQILAEVHTGSDCRSLAISTTARRSTS